MTTIAALNLVLLLILPALAVAVLVSRPDEAQAVPRARLCAAFVTGLASSLLLYPLTGFDGWGDYHLSIFVALAITLAAAAFMARRGRQRLRFWPMALAGYLGILVPPILLFALLMIACAGVECCMGC